MDLGVSRAQVSHLHSFFPGRCLPCADRPCCSRESGLQQSAYSARTAVSSLPLPLCLQDLPSEMVGPICAFWNFSLRCLVSVWVPRFMSFYFHWKTKHNNINVMVRVGVCNSLPALHAWHPLSAGAERSPGKVSFGKVTHKRVTFNEVYTSKMESPS